MPFVIRNIILSGYVIFPFPGIDIFNFDWKVPYESALNLKKLIKGWAILPHIPYEKVLSMPLTEWFPLWYSRQASFNIFMFNSIIFLSVFNLFKFRKNPVLYLTVYTGVVFWFFNAPDFRFGYGFIVVLSALSYVNMTNLLLEFFKINIRKYYVLISILLVYLALVGGYLAFNKIIISTAGLIYNTRKYHFYPAPYVKFPVKQVRLNNFYVYVPLHKDDRTGFSPLPSTPNIKSRKNLRLRGNNLEKGFKMP